MDEISDEQNSLTSDQMIFGYLDSCHDVYD